MRREQCFLGIKVIAGNGIRLAAVAQEVQEAREAQILSLFRCMDVNEKENLSILYVV